jgi:hypothetical protein
VTLLLKSPMRSTPLEHPLFAADDRRRPAVYSGRADMVADPSKIYLDI